MSKLLTVVSLMVLGSMAHAQSLSAACDTQRITGVIQRTQAALETAIQVGNEDNIMMNEISLANAFVLAKRCESPALNLFSKDLLERQGVDEMIQRQLRSN